MKLKTRFSLVPGDMHLRSIPEISFEHGYLWIGEAKSSCYATLSGNKTLRLFAKSLLKVLDNAR